MVQKRWAMCLGLGDKDEKMTITEFNENDAEIMDLQSLVSYPVTDCFTHPLCKPQSTIHLPEQLAKVVAVSVE